MFHRNQCGCPKLHLTTCEKLLFFWVIFEPLALSSQTAISHNSWIIRKRKKRDHSDSKTNEFINREENGANSSFRKLVCPLQYLQEHGSRIATNHPFKVTIWFLGTATSLLSNEHTVNRFRWHLIFALGLPHSQPQSEIAEKNLNRLKFHAYWALLGSDNIKAGNKMKQECTMFCPLPADCLRLIPCVCIRL